MSSKAIYIYIYIYIFGYDFIVSIKYFAVYLPVPIKTEAYF